jgi:Fe-S-cluster containining protein
LHIQDLPLIQEGFINKSHLFAMRKGELVTDNINHALIVIREEMTKVKEKGGTSGGCIFYNEEGKACRIYQHRPAQCAALACWDTAEFVRAYAGQKLERKDLVDDEALLGLMEEHERRCSYATLETYVRRIESEGEKAVEKILGLLRYDYQFRPFISEKLDLNPEEMALFFGRPLIQTISMFGLQVFRKSDGSFFLTAIKKGGPQKYPPFIYGYRAG